MRRLELAARGEHGGLILAPERNGDRNGGSTQANVIITGLLVLLPRRLRMGVVAVGGGAGWRLYALLSLSRFPGSLESPFSLDS